jgi:hypothetical protein
MLCSQMYIGHILLVSKSKINTTFLTVSFKSDKLTILVINAPRIFLDLKTNVASRELTKPHNENTLDVYSSINIIKAIKCIRFR